MKTFIFHVKGMHCASCPILIRSELLETGKLYEVKASLNNHTVQVTGDFVDRSAEQVADELSTVLKPHGYSLSTEKTKHSIAWRDFKFAVPFALAFIALFVGLQKLGVVNLINASSVTYGTAFVVGLVASVSTCMAVVGGIVLSMSANFAKGGDKVRPQVLFHAGRLVSFFVLGGVIGALGSAFQLGATGMLVLGLLVAAVLIILGMNLLDIFPWMKRLQISLPGFLGHHVRELKQVNHTLTPLLVGVATFFLPCGFTQSMQIYSLTTGSFWNGAMTMFSFALGTLPVLAILSFSSLGIHEKARSGIFFKTAGLVVIFFGIFNLVNALVAAQIIPPLFNF